MGSQAIVARGYYSSSAIAAYYRHGLMGSAASDRLLLNSVAAVVLKEGMIVDWHFKPATSPEDQALSLVRATLAAYLMSVPDKWDTAFPIIIPIARSTLRRMQEQGSHPDLLYTLMWPKSRPIEVQLHGKSYTAGIEPQPSSSSQYLWRFVINPSNPV